MAAADCEAEKGSAAAGEAAAARAALEAALAAEQSAHSAKAAEFAELRRRMNEDFVPKHKKLKERLDAVSAEAAAAKAALEAQVGGEGAAAAR